MAKRCNIPARTLPACDLEWGHEGDMHANAGDGFYAREYDEVHRSRRPLFPPWVTSFRQDGDYVSLGPSPGAPKREMWLAEQIADLCILWGPRDMRLRTARIDDCVDYAAGMK